MLQPRDSEVRHTPSRFFFFGVRYDLAMMLRASPPLFRVILIFFRRYRFFSIYRDVILLRACADIAYDERAAAALRVDVFAMSFPQ